MTIDVRVLFAAVLLLVPAAALAKDEKRDEPTALAVFRGDVSKLTEGWRRLLKETEPHRKKVEEARAACRRAERSHGKSTELRNWKRRWESTTADRVQIHNAIFRHFLAWSQPALALFETHDAKPLTPQLQAQVAKVSADRVRAWIEIGEPGTIRGVIDSVTGGVPRALALPGRAPPRRALLAAVVDRIAATPGTTDLDALLGVLAWEVLFVDGIKPKERLDTVSGDLILLFTERAENGLSKSSRKYYKAGRFEDRGFARRFRDASDQVRHFAWAFRMFAVSSNPDLTSKMLRMKEEQDAKTRKKPLSQEDLALNASARKLVGDILGGEDGANPVSAEGWGRLFREELAR